MGHDTEAPSPVNVSGSILSLNSSLLNLSNTGVALMDERREKEIQQECEKFIKTARELYKTENVDAFNDVELAKHFSGPGKFHFGRALSSLAETLAWRREHNINTILDEDFSDLEATGKAQFFGTCRGGYPILVVQLARHVPPKDQVGREREARYAVYLIERARAEGVLTDKMTVIVDRSQATSAQADTSTFRTIAPILQRHYPERLAHMLIFPSTTLFWMAYKLARAGLDPVTAQKIELKESPVALFAIIEADNLFSRYGGTHKDPHEPLGQTTPVETSFPDSSSDDTTSQTGDVSKQPQPPTTTPITASTTSKPATQTTTSTTRPSSSGFKFRWRSSSSATSATAAAAAAAVTPAVDTAAKLPIATTTTTASPTSTKSWDSLSSSPPSLTQLPSPVSPQSTHSTTTTATTSPTNADKPPPPPAATTTTVISNTQMSMPQTAASAPSAASTTTTTTKITVEVLWEATGSVAEMFDQLYQQTKKAPPVPVMNNTDYGDGESGSIRQRVSDVLVPKAMRVAALEGSGGKQEELLRDAVSLTGDGGEESGRRRFQHGRDVSGDWMVGDGL